MLTPYGARRDRPLIQAMVPDDLRGRVMAVYSMMFMGMAPFGALWAGWVAERIGAPHTIVVGGVACVGGALIFGVRLPSLRGEARALIVAQGLAGGDPPAEMTGPAQEVPAITKTLPRSTRTLTEDTAHIK